jgi:predicted membrane chloride channel (bestrophin family)
VRRRCCLDTNITALGDALGGCERIFKTPIPLSYTRHTSRVLIIWLAVLPFW